MCKIRPSTYSSELCCATCSSGDRTGLHWWIRAEHLEHVVNKMCELGVGQCFLNVLCFFSSSLQLTILIGLCLTLYHPVVPMPPSHQVRKNTCTSVHFSLTLSVFSYGALSPVMGERYWELRAILRICVRECGVDVVNICNCCSGAYNNAGLVSVGGVITACGPPPSYNSTHKVAGMIPDRAFACGWQ